MLPPEVIQQIQRMKQDCLNHANDCDDKVIPFAFSMGGFNTLVALDEWLINNGYA